MSSPVLSRPLPLVPFLAADGGLLLTALLIAWRTPGELAGGALLAVVVCVGFGAALAVLPFVLNDAREREAALAERQRELVELVNTSTASAARWGTQWASAATGLEDAAQLASRSIAMAERLPVIFQEKADALAEQLAQAGREAQARAEKSAQQDRALAAQMARVEREALARLEQSARQEAAIAAVMAEAAAAAQQVRVAREELDGRVAAIPAQVEVQVSQISRVAGEAEARLGATAEALTARLAAVEVMIGEVLAKLERLATAASGERADGRGKGGAETVVAETTVPVVQPVVEKAKVIVSSEAIMDPFLIPDDGYAGLAEAMDARNT